jgi:chitodextrinase
MRLFVLLSIFVFLPTSVLFAQSDTSSFFIRTFIGDDTEAPSTPTLSATAVASTQVNASWMTATDNFLVSGYVLSRDGLPLATTTLTSYTDTTVVASTTYVYSVRAFDPAFNYSSSSNLVSVTTPAPVAPPVVDNDTGGGTAARVVLNDFVLIPDTRSAQLILATERPARFTIRWGRTNSYEIGYTETDVFAKSYETTLTDLEPGTRYQYEVIGITPLGARTVLETGAFTTLGLQDLLPPENVAFFRTSADGNDVRLEWQLPQTPFSRVRILRSHLGFPKHLTDGVVVYEGRATEAIDTNALLRYSPVYYTAFVIAEDGTVSSGAVSRVFATDGEDVIETSLPGESGVGFEDEPTASTSPTLPEGTRMPTFEEIGIQQFNTQYTFQTRDIVLDPGASFLLSIPATSVSGNLKTIVGSLSNPSDSRESFSFLLRINKDGSAYEAVIPAVMLEGTARVVLDIYDFESQVVGTYKKSVRFSAPQAETDRVVRMPFLAFGVVIIIGLASIPFFFGLKRKKKREDNK